MDKTTFTMSKSKPTSLTTLIFSLLLLKEAFKRIILFRANFSKNFGSKNEFFKFNFSCKK